MFTKALAFVASSVLTVSSFPVVAPWYYLNYNYNPWYVQHQIQWDNVNYNYIQNHLANVHEWEQDRLNYWNSFYNTPQGVEDYRQEWLDYYQENQNHYYETIHNDRQKYLDQIAG